MIGISSKTKINGENKISSLINQGFRLIELNHNSTSLHFIDYKEKELKSLKQEKNLYFFIHSLTLSFFHPNKIISNSQKEFLKSEILYAKNIGALGVIFHMDYRAKIDGDTQRIVSFFEEIVDFADSNKVQLYIENNTYSDWSRPKTFEFLLKKHYPKLKFLLDIGHAYKAVYNKEVSSLEDFKILKEFTEYMHIHDNHGEKDEHLALGKGTIPLSKVISLIKEISPKYIVIETRNIEDALITKRILKENKVI